jgi:hypothetical protein
VCCSGTIDNFYLYLAIMFLAGFHAHVRPTTTLLQEMVEPDMQGRVFGVMQLIMSTAMPLGMLVFGPIADVISVQTLLVVTSALMIIRVLDASQVPEDRAAASPDYQLPGIALAGDAIPRRREKSDLRDDGIARRLRRGARQGERLEPHR